ncbi:MAG: serine/threonine protein kinase [Gemmataceae bacterium]|nr:serine/threonine protein kinase [Gemmataceae bacterium]MCI0741439.1 serine/threonine protein kinase [Gemmataceae bacterium]
MVPTTSRALIEALTQCRLLGSEQLRQASDLAHRESDPRQLARHLGQRNFLTIYQINQLLAGRAKDLVLGPYRFLDRLGQGGLSSVYKARHVDYDWLVALKVLRPEAMASEAGRRQFLLEMEAMAQMDHPNIVGFVDVDEWDNTFYFAMEFVDGIDLAKLVTLSGPMPVSDACDYIRQAALGLQHAHERNLVHRDIKPGNLFLTQGTGGDLGVPGRPEGEESARRGTKGKAGKNRPKAVVKILDWGLATLRLPKGYTGPQLLENLARGIVGTADYLSPEQARDHTAVDIRGDIYSLGCAFYFLLTGQPPFTEGSLIQKLLQHKQAEPEPVSAFREDVPPRVVEILHRMMAKNPDDRFQTPAAVALALMAFSRDENCELTRLCRKVAMRKTPPAALKDQTPLPAALEQPPPIKSKSRHKSSVPSDTRGF